MMHSARLLTMGAIALAVAAVTVPALGQTTGVEAELIHAAPPSSTITPAQRARLAEKLRLVDQIVGVAAETNDGSAVTPEQLRWLRESLYMLPLAEVQAIGIPGGFRSAATAVSSTQRSPRVAKALGDPTTDLVYRPITPCRYIDTRVKPPMVGSTPYGVDLGQTGASYGGSAGCNIVTAAGLTDASDIAAVNMNVGIVNPQFQPGFLGARPAGSANSTSMVNWYQAGPTVQASNAGAVTTSGAATGSNQIEFFGTPTDLVVDVLGVFARPGATPFNCNFAQLDGTGTGNVAIGAQFTIPSPPQACQTGFTPVGLGCTYGPVAPAGLSLVSKSIAVAPTDFPQPGFASCAWVNGSTTALNGSDFHAITRCCQVPGR
ncbi:MAG TPA: hypothetical protein VFU90_00280 [Candidatus Tumulicola sp.]|nr:hypothetical protein [Candidatus Tumulicola sp.]